MTYKFNVIALKILAVCVCVCVWKLINIQKFIRKLIELGVVKTNLEEENKFRGYKLPDFKPYNKAEITKTCDIVKMVNI